MLEKWTEIKSKLREGVMYPVASSLDMDYLRILMDCSEEDYRMISHNDLEKLKCTEGKFVLIHKGESVASSKKMRISDLYKGERVIFFDCALSHLMHDAPIGDLLDFSNEYETPIRLLVQAYVRKAYRKSVFFSSEGGIWILARTLIYFPYSCQTMDKQFLYEITSSRDILTCYDQIKNLKVIEIRPANHRI